MAGDPRKQFAQAVKLCQAGRVGATLLAHAGCPQWVARSGDEYLAIAVGLAADIGSLGRIRAGLRDSLGRSPLMDAVAHTRAVEVVYRDMWRKFCNRGG